MSAVINLYLKKINRGLAALLQDVNRRYRLSLICDELFRYSKEFILRKGKRIRPLLFILAYKGYSSLKSHSDNGLFTSAAAIELLHDYMLIHDDVIDNSDVRRGQPTLHKRFDQKIQLPDHAKIGPQLAIVAGDVIFAVAIEAFLSIKEDRTRKETALCKFVETAATTGAGEFIDVVYGHRRLADLSEKEVFLTYTLKTAKYTFEGPLVMGAILAGANKNELKKLSELGLYAGQAFQIYDDFLDLFASQRVIGKPILRDLTESKKTLLMVKTYQKLKGKDKLRFKKVFEKKNKTYADLKLLRAFVIQSSAYQDCLRKMTALQKKAIHLCQSLKMKKAYKKTLEGIILKLSPSRMSLKV